MGICIDLHKHTFLNKHLFVRVYTRVERLFSGVCVWPRLFNVGASSVRSTGRSPRNAADHYGYLLMQLCQQHRERRTRQVQSASLPASPLSLSTGTASALGVARAEACVTAGCPAFSMHRSGGSGYRFSPAYEPAESVACPAACAGDCRPLPANAVVAGSVCGCHDKEYTASPRSAREASCCTGVMLQPFPASYSICNNSAGSGNSSSCTALTGKDEISIDAATTQRRQRAAAEGKGCEFLLGSPRHQKQKQQPTHQHRQQHLSQQPKWGANFPAETPVSPPRYSQRRDEATATLGFHEGKNLSSPRGGNRPMACNSQCTCSSTCSKPCGRAEKSTVGGGAFSNATDTRVLHETAYESVSSNFAWNRECVTACSDGVGAAGSTVCNPICWTNVCSTSPALCCKDTCLTASESVTMTRGGVDVVQQQSCNTTTRHDYQEASGGTASAAHEENELEYYICSAADDRVGRYCESGCTREAAFEQNQRDIYMQTGSALQKTIPLETSQQKCTSPEARRPKGAEAPEWRPSTASESNRQQRATAEGQSCTTRENAGTTGGVPVVSENEGRGEATGMLMSYTHHEEIPSEGGCLDEQHPELISRTRQQEGIWKSSSVYDNELEMYEHHNVDVWVRMYIRKTTSQVTPLSAPHPATAGLYASPAEFYQESQQQGSWDERMKGVPEFVEFNQLNSGLSSSSNRPPLAAGTKGKAEKVTALARRSSSVSGSNPQGSPAAGKTNYSGNSKSSVVSSPRSPLGTARTAAKRSGTSSTVLLSTSAARGEAGPAREAPERKASTGDSECNKHTAQKKETRLELDEIPVADAAAPVPRANSRGSCSSFFRCLSPQRKRLSSSRSSSQSDPINSTAKQALACSSAATPRSSAVEADTLDTCHLHAEKVFRPEAAAAALLEATTLSAIPVAPTTCAIAAAAETALHGVAVETSTPSAAEAFHPASKGAQDSAEQLRKSYNERDRHDELEIYEYKANHYFVKTDNSLYLQSDEGSNTTGFRKLRWNWKEHCRVDSATAAYTRVQASPSNSSSIPSRYNEYENQDAYASSQQQGCTAPGTSAAPPQQEMIKAPGGRERDERNEPGCSSSVPSALSATVHTCTGVTQHCCDPLAAKHWLLQEKAWGACHACINCGEAAVAGSQNSCDKQGFRRENGVCSQVALPRRLYETTEDSSPPTWPPAEDAAAPGEVSLLKERAPRQQMQPRPHGKERKNACTLQQTLHEKETLHCQYMYPEGQRDRSCPFPQQQGHTERQRLAQQQHHCQPQRQRQSQGQLDQQLQFSPAQKHQQQRRGRKQQQSTQSTGRSGSAACKRQQVEDIFPTGRQDWHVAAYEDAVELKKKRQNLDHNARSRSSSRRELQTAAGGTSSTEHVERKGQAYREAPSATLATPVASVDMHCDTVPCSPDDVNGGLPLQPDRTASRRTWEQENLQQFSRQQDDMQRPSYCDVAERRTLLQERQPRAEMSQAPETQQQLSTSALQRQANCSDVTKQYHPRPQQQGGTQVPQSGNSPGQPQGERDIQAKSAPVAPYPLHTYHHLKQRDYKDMLHCQNTTCLPPKERASRPIRKEKGDGCREMENNVQQRVENCCRIGERRQEEEMYCSGAVGGIKGSRSSWDSVNIDSCRIQGETNRNSEGHSYLSVPETLMYDKLAPYNRSPVPCSSLALSPASPSEQEAGLPLSGAQQATDSRRGVWQQGEEVQEGQSKGSDVRCNTWLSHPVGCCREQRQDQQRHQQQQPVQDQQQHHHQHREDQRQPSEQQPQQHQLQRVRKHQPEQLPLYGECEREANQVDRPNRQKQTPERETLQGPRPAGVTLKCTSPVTPTYQEKTAAVGSCW